MPNRKLEQRRGSAKEKAYLTRLAERIRSGRAQRGMTRTALAADSGVSLRFLAQLEAGEGNPSLLVLHRIASAMGFQLEALLSDKPSNLEDRSRLDLMLENLSGSDLSAARQMLTERFGNPRPTRPSESYMALIGLRGAGKTTLGRRLAIHRGVPFFELDREVEREYGATIGEILQLHGQPGYRRFERQSLQTVLSKHPAAVIETGGGLAADPDTLPLLLQSAVTVWLRASPEEHMQRVIDQGDLRPMARTKEAMRELRDILKAREPYYKQAHMQVNTSGKTVDESFSTLLKTLGERR